MIAGIASDKTLAGTGIDGFTVAKFNSSSNLLQNSFGSAITGVTGNLAFMAKLLAENPITTNLNQAAEKAEAESDKAQN